LLDHLFLRNATCERQTPRSVLGRDADTQRQFYAQIFRCLSACGSVRLLSPRLLSPRLLSPGQGRAEVGGALAQAPSDGRPQQRCGEQHRADERGEAHTSHKARGRHACCACARADRPLSVVSSVACHASTWRPWLVCDMSASMMHCTPSCLDNSRLVSAYTTA